MSTLNEKLEYALNAFFEAKGMPSKSHVMDMCKDGMSFADMCKMHPDADRDELKALVDKCKEELKGEDKLDPVGKEDDDVDNDGDSDSTDDYLKKKRAAIGKAIDAKKLKEMAKASKTESIKGGLEKGADGYSSHDYHRIAIALAGGKMKYDRMPYGTAQSYRDKAHQISNSEKDRILSQPTPR